MIGEDFKIQNMNEYILKEKRRLNLEIGEKLREKRREKNVNLVELAEKTNTSQTYISQIEKGEYSISLFKFIFFCNALEINVLEFLDEFIYKEQSNEDILYEKLQNDKNLSKNVLEYLKEKS